MTEPKRTPAEEPRDIFVKVSGKSFRCDCGCNVFRSPAIKRYACNSCGAKYVGE